MAFVLPKSAARRLASELMLLSWKGAVVVAHRSDEDVLVVAAEQCWLSHHALPPRYCGYVVEAGEPLNAIAHAR
jgi:hypothetical protein